MLLVSNISKSYGAQTLFQEVSFIINKGERVGLVGKNGHGKSTLLRMILKEEEPDSGTITYPDDYKIGHLSQHLNFTEKTILDECCLALPLLDGCWKESYKAEAMLHGLGFSERDFLKAPSEFSGGYQIRLNLAKLLLSEPNLLLLDEPTNYLDIVSVRWLGRFLNTWQNEAIIITHDRSFMDSVTTHTVAIHRTKAKKVEGGTDKVYEALTEEEELYEKTRVNEEKKKKEIEKFVERFRAKASKAKSVQSRVKQLDKMEVGDELSTIEDLDFKFISAPFPGKWIMHADSVSFRYNSESDFLFKDFNLAVGKEDRIAIIGPNGKGKTTLLNVLANEFEPEKGAITYNDNTRLGYFGQTNIDRLAKEHTVEEEIALVDQTKSRTVVRSICGAMMFEGDLALKKVSVLSGGERSRVMLGKLLVTPSNLLLLDEPTNHLDMQSIESLLEAIKNFSGAVIMVTHSEMILHQVATKLIVFDRGEISLFDGTYQDFLDRVGWEEEDSLKPSKKPKPAKSKETKIPSDKKKLEQKIKKIEAEINAKEKETSLLHQEIAKASKENNVSKLGSLSKKLKCLENEVEKAFEQLEQETDKLEGNEYQPEA